MRINREEILRKLEQVRPGLAVREVIEQSAAFVFREGHVFTFNDEVFARVALPSDLTGAVHAAPLLTLLSKLADEEVELAVSGGELLVNGKRGRSGIKMEAEVLLPIESVEIPTEWAELNPEFVDAVEIVQTCASGNDTNFNLTCIHIHPDWLEACDNYQITRYPLKTGVSEPILVRKEAIKHIIGLGMNEIAFGASWIHFRSPVGLSLSCRRWTEKYPDYTPILNVTGTKTVLPGGLGEEVAKAEIFSADNARDNQVLVQLKEDRLRLKGEGAHGWYESRAKIAYRGPEISFLIAPKLLTEITGRTNECEIAPGRLKIDAGRFFYLACLGAVEKT